MRWLSIAEPALPATSGVNTKVWFVLSYVAAPLTTALFDSAIGSWTSGTGGGVLGGGSGGLGRRPGLKRRVERIELDLVQDRSRRRSSP